MEKWNLCSQCRQPVADPFEHLDGCPKPAVRRAGVHYREAGKPWCGASVIEPTTILCNDVTCPKCESRTTELWAELTKNYP